MKKLLLVTVMALAGFVLSGCVLQMPDPLLKQSDSATVPDISGSYKNEKGETIKVKKVAKTTNAFDMIPPDKGPTLTVIVEPLAETNGFLFQVKNPNGNDVVLAIGKIVGKDITLYAIDPEKIVKLAKQYKIDLKEETLIVGFQSPQDLLAMFNECFKPEYSEPLTAIKRD